MKVSFIYLTQAGLGQEKLSNEVEREFSDEKNLSFKM